MQDEKKTVQLTIRFTDSQYKKIQAEAKKAERKEADFVRVAVMRYIEISEKTK